MKWKLRDGDIEEMKKWKNCNYKLRELSYIFFKWFFFLRFFFNPVFRYEIQKFFLNIKINYYRKIEQWIRKLNNVLLHLLLEKHSHASINRFSLWKGRKNVSIIDKMALWETLSLSLFSYRPPTGRTLRDNFFMLFMWSTKKMSRGVLCGRKWTRKKIDSKSFFPWFFFYSLRVNNWIKC